MRTWRVIAAIGMLSVLGACSHPPTTQSSSSSTTQLSSPPVTSTSSSATSPTTSTAESPGTEPPPEPSEESNNGPTTEPSTEGTGPETAQTQQAKPSITIAQLPIGGSPADDNVNCNPVSWLGGGIPAGTTITLGTPRFEPKGIFEVDQSGCSGDTQPCEGVKWTADDQPQCAVGFKQVANEGTVTLVIPARVTCASQADCDSLKKLGGSQIDLTAQAPATPETSETPSETPTETPSGNG